MSTPLPASHVANKAAAAARSSFPKKWTNLQDWFDNYSRFLCKQEQPPHLALADSDVVEALEKRFRTFVKELDDMRAVSGFYQAFANLSESDHRFSSTEAIEYLRPKLNSIILTRPSTSTIELDLALFLTSLHLPLEQRPSANSEFAAITQHFLAQFTRPFKGNALLRFLRFALGVQAYFDGCADRDFYLKGTPIVQSSGTGKTCMVLELANYAPLLYICLHAQGSTLLQGFLQSEVKPVNYFVNSLEKQTLNNKGKPSGIC